MVILNWITNIEGFTIIKSNRINKKTYIRLSALKENAYKRRDEIELEIKQLDKQMSDNPSQENSELVSKRKSLKIILGGDAFFELFE